MVISNPWQLGVFLICPENLGWPLKFLLEIKCNKNIFPATNLGSCKSSGRQTKSKHTLNLPKSLALCLTERSFGGKNSGCSCEEELQFPNIQTTLIDEAPLSPLRVAVPLAKVLIWEARGAFRRFNCIIFLPSSSKKTCLGWGYTGMCELSNHLGVDLCQCDYQKKKSKGTSI